MPGWQIVLIAADSALLASALTLLAVRLARRTTPAQPSTPDTGHLYGRRPGSNDPGPRPYSRVFQASDVHKRAICAPKPTATAETSHSYSAGGTASPPQIRSRSVSGAGRRRCAWNRLIERPARA
jgi:hypothetical protein